MSSLKEYIKRIEEAAGAVIEAKQALGDGFQQEIQTAKGKTENAKRAKVIRELRDANPKIVANPNCHLNDLINNSQLEGVAEDEKPVRPAKDPKPLITFKRPGVQERTQVQSI